MKLEIITPEKEYFSGEVEYVEIPGIEGHMGLLPGHAPLVTMLNDEPDEDLKYKVDKNSKEIELALGPGYLEIAQDKISVLTDWIVSEEDDIDVDAAEEAMQRAKDALENAPGYFGEKFNKHFEKHGGYDGLLDRAKKGTLADLMLEDEELAAAFAAVQVIRTFDQE